MNAGTKTALRPEIVERLQSLIQTNLDSRDGLLEAAEHVGDAGVAKLCHETAAKRNQQASELRTIVASEGDEPQSTGSYAAAAHRGWMDLRAALGGGVSAMLSEAERGEDYIKRRYEEAIDALAGSPITGVLHRHYGDVKSGHDRIRNLRDAFQD